jgi:hypothetical protein
MTEFPAAVGGNIRCLYIEAIFASKYPQSKINLALSRYKKNVESRRRIYSKIHNLAVVATSQYSLDGNLKPALSSPCTKPPTLVHNI